ncbi:MAG TPA: SMC-Scp complex subunit ScpB [Polyangiaceae bacterium]|nr:SMC-Scp complex subunit ScpB [Polyangiaceae bacterium]
MSSERRGRSNKSRVASSDVEVRDTPAPAEIVAVSASEAPETGPAPLDIEESSTDVEAGSETDAQEREGDATEGEGRDVNDIVEGDAESPAVTLPAGDVSRAHLKGLIEALVFVSDKPVSLNELAKVAGKADKKLVRALVDELRADYAPRGIHFDEVAGGVIFRTNPSYGAFVRDVAAKKPVRMTRAQLETLAIIAYRQPLTRPEVDDIRGVDSGPVMKMLLDRDLVRILGKKDEPGRPLLYGTTPLFLEFFGLKSLKDMPSLREFTELSDDSRRVYEKEMAEAGELTEEREATAPANIENLAAAASSVTPSAEDMSDAPPTLRPATGGASPPEAESASADAGLADADAAKPDA